MKSLADFQQLVEARRVIYLDGPVNDEMIRSLRKQIADLDSKAEEVAITLKTSGGPTGPGFAIIHELQSLAAKRHIWIIAESYVNSFGLYIMTAFPVEQRLAFALTTFYGHWGNMNRKIRLHGTPKQVRYQVKEVMADIDLFEREQKLLIDMMAEGTAMSRKQVKMLFSKPKSLSAQQAKKLGIISHILA